jgi:hypothetical protein
MRFVSRDLAFTNWPRAAGKPSWALILTTYFDNKLQRVIAVLSQTQLHRIPELPTLHEWVLAFGKFDLGTIALRAAPTIREAAGLATVLAHWGNYFTGSFVWRCPNPQAESLTASDLPSIGAKKFSFIYD